jgi:hypothetical protein
VKTIQPTRLLLLQIIVSKPVMLEANTRELMSFLGNINLHVESISLKTAGDYGRMKVQLHTFLTSA